MAVLQYMVCVASVYLVCTNLQLLVTGNILNMMTEPGYSSKQASKRHQYRLHETRGKSCTYFIWSYSMLCTITGYRRGGALDAVALFYTAFTTPTAYVITSKLNWIKSAAGIHHSCTVTLSSTDRFRHCLQWCEGVLLDVWRYYCIVRCTTLLHVISSSQAPAIQRFYCRILYQPSQV